MQKEVKFQTEEFAPAWASDYAEDKFAVYSTCFLSTKKNSHELDISEEVLKRDAKSILGNFLIADIQNGDSTTHTDSQQIYGYFPKEQEIEFDESEEGIVKAKAYCVISKMYSSEFNEIFSADNLRNTSVEMKVTLGDDEHEVLDFDIYALTCLGKTVNGSCPDAQMQMVRFDAEQAETFFKEKEKVEFSSTIENKTNKNEEGKESDEKMTEIEFAAVDIGNMWGQLYDALHNKYPDGDYSSVYYIEDIYEENNQKFAIIRHKDEDNRYRLDFSLTEDGLVLADEIIKVEVEIVETDVVRKFAEPENVEKYRAFAKEQEVEDTEPKTVEMSIDEMKTEMARLQAEVESKDATIEEKEIKMSEMTAELEELRNFKNVHEENEKASKVEAVLSEVAKFMDKETVDKFREEGMQCNFSAIDGWVNSVKASAYDNAIKFSKKEKEDEGFTRMSFATSNAQKPHSNSALERIKEQYL